MIINYDATHTTIKVGVPFTWGSQNAWFIKSASGVLIRLEDGQEYRKPEMTIFNAGGLRYASSMELK